MEEKQPLAQNSSNFFEKKWIVTILHYVAAILLPNIFFLNLYNRNRLELLTPFRNIIIVALIFALISVFAFLLFRFFTRTYEGALLVLILCWLSFWLFNTILSGLRLYFPTLRATILLFGLLALIALLALFLRLRKIAFRESGFVFIVLSFVIGLLFVFNVFPNIAQESVAFEFDAEEQFSIKRDFNVDESLPNPDIYWLMPDGMISFVDFEIYFEDSQYQFKELLVERGFLIYEDGRSAGSTTALSLPTLLSPSYYDNIKRPINQQLEGIINPQLRRYHIGDMLGESNINMNVDIWPYWELFLAFMENDYTAVHIAPHMNEYQVADHFYRLSCLPLLLGVESDPHNTVERYPLAISNDSRRNRNILRRNADLVNLLIASTPLNFVFPSISDDYVWESIPEHAEEVERLVEKTRGTQHERQVYRNFIDAMDIPSPRIVFTTIFFTHFSGWVWQALEGDVSNQEPHYLYRLAHEYTVLVLMNLVDEILEANPNAVIVIQADHGMHNPDFQERMLESGFTDNDLLRLNYSVMSAVRIPPEYGGLEEPIAPLNITRELVNRFVGENYELIPQ